MAALQDDLSAATGASVGEEACAPLSMAVVSGAKTQEIDAKELSVAQYRERAQVLRLCGRWTEAVEAARKAIALDPLDPFGRNLLVNILLERGEFEAVLAESSNWLRLQPYNTAALEALAKAHWYRGDIDAALRAMKRLLRLNSYEPNYRFQRGVLYQYKGAWGLAMQDFLAVLESTCADEVRARTQEAVISLENWQLRLIAMLVMESPVFRIEFQMDAEKAVADRGFRLTDTGMAMLRFLPCDKDGCDADTQWFRQE